MKVTSVVIKDGEIRARRSLAEFVRMVEAELADPMQAAICGRVRQYHHLESALLDHQNAYYAEKLSSLKAEAREAQGQARRAEADMRRERVERAELLRQCGAAGGQ